MNNAEPVVFLDFDYVPAEADGSACCVCGDPIYLNAFKVELYLPGTGEKVAEVPEKLCWGCGEELIRERKNGEEPFEDGPHAYNEY